jgi:RNA polymerase sigma-70 factor (ECF subfamily)
MAWPAHDASAPAPPHDVRALVGLVERARTGDRDAFTALFAQFNARICTYLARLVGDDDLGRDLAQDTFLAAWRALPEMRDAARFSGWLYRIATNAAHSHLRRGRVLFALPWGDPDDSGARQPFSVVGPEQHAGEAERVRLALAALAPRNRACLLLQLEGGFAQREIAALLGIGEKAVSAYVSRGREQFRQAYERLEREGERPPSAGSAPDAGSKREGGPA